MKKKILVTSALASSLIFLGSNATAQTKIDGSLTLSYKQIDFDLATSKVNNVRGLGREAQLNVSNSGNLNIGGIKYAAGFALEFDGGKERLTNGDLSIANENTYVDFIIGDTTLTFGVDHIQNSDRTTANFVGMNVEDMDNGNTFFLSTIGANPKEAMGAGVVQKTPFGSFSILYVPTNGLSGLDDDLDNFTEDASPLPSGVTNADRSSAYEAGFIGDLGIKGLQAMVFKNKEKASPGSVNKDKSLEGTTVGVSYNFGIITAGIDKKKSKGKYTKTDADNNSETSQTGYGLAYAITPTLTLGANYTKANTTGPTTSVVDEKYKSIALGYNLGPVVAEVQYGQFQNAKGVGSADFTSTYARLITKF
jgi:hypothetical protein